MIIASPSKSHIQLKSITVPLDPVRRVRVHSISAYCLLLNGTALEDVVVASLALTYLRL